MRKVIACKRSDFVNQALEEAINSCLRKKAAESMDVLAQQNDLRMSTGEFVKLKNCGRS